MSRSLQNIHLKIFRVAAAIACEKIADKVGADVDIANLESVGN